MSCRWPGKPLVRQGPDQLTPASYEKNRPVFVPTTTFLLLFGSTRTFETAWYCGQVPPLAAGYAGVKTFAPSVCHEFPASVLLSTPALPKAKEPKLISPVAA